MSINTELDQGAAGMERSLSLTLRKHWYQFKITPFFSFPRVLCIEWSERTLPCRASFCNIHQRGSRNLLPAKRCLQKGLVFEVIPWAPIRSHLTSPTDTMNRNLTLHLPQSHRENQHSLFGGENPKDQEQGLRGLSAYPSS